MALTRTDDHESVHYGSAHPAASPKAEVEIADDDPRLWGWHHTGNGSTSRKAGIAVIVILLCMLMGNHHGHVEDLWLIVTAAIIGTMLVLNLSSKRKSTWRK